MSVREAYNHGQFCWVDLAANDLGAAADFYHQVFGWTTDTADTQGGPPYLLFQNDGYVVAGAAELSPDMKAAGVPAMWNNYIYVHDVAATLDKAQKLGAIITVPTMKIFEAGWLGFLQDPTGAQVGLWQKNQFGGATRVNDAGCFCWNELATRDFASARAFYGELFGWTYKENKDSPARYEIIECAGCENGGIMEMTPEWGEVPPHWTAYFTVAKLDDTVTRLKTAGGRLHCEPFDIPVGRLAVAADAQGAGFNLIELNMPPD